MIFYIYEWRELKITMFKSFKENFKKIHWDSKKEVSILFAKILVVSAIAVGILSGVQWLIEFIFRRIAA